jgi:hypothetical protein
MSLYTFAPAPAAAPPKGSPLYRAMVAGARALERRALAVTNPAMPNAGTWPPADTLAEAIDHAFRMGAPA